LATIRVSGSLEAVREQLRRIAAHIRGRKDDGWTAFRDDETWEYYTEEDNVCYICEGFGREFEIAGWRILDEMPDQMPTNYSDTLYRHRYPNIHESQNLYPGLRGVCRCNMFWRDPVETLTQRLGRELEMII